MNLLWKRYHIIELPNKAKCLILVYDNNADADFMLNLLQNNEIEVKIIHNDKSEYSFILNIRAADFTIQSNEFYSIEKYPPIEWAVNGLVTQITTGVISGNNFVYRMDAKEISTFSYN